MRAVLVFESGGCEKAEFQPDRRCVRPGFREPVDKIWNEFMTVFFLGDWVVKGHANAYLAEAIQVSASKELAQIFVPFFPCCRRLVVRVVEVHFL